MPEYKDVIRICDTKANVALLLREKMIGFCTDTLELAVKAPGGAMHYFPIAAALPSHYANLYVDGSVIHYGDSGTQLSFGVDALALLAAGILAVSADMTGAQKFVKINETGADVDFSVNGSDGNAVISVDAANKQLTAKDIITSEDIYRTKDTEYTPVLRPRGTGAAPVFDVAWGHYKQIGKTVIGSCYFENCTSDGVGSNYLLCDTPVLAKSMDILIYPVGSAVVDFPTCSVYISKSAVTQMYDSAGATYFRFNRDGDISSCEEYLTGPLRKLQFTFAYEAAV